MYTGLVWNDGPPQIHVSIILHPPPPSLLNNQPPSVSDRVNGAKSCSSFEQARASKRSSQHGNTFYVLSPSYCQYRFLSAASRKRLTSFHGLYLSSRIISFVSLLRQPFSQTGAALSAVYHTRKGGGTIVPSFTPPPLLRSKTLKSIDRIANEVELFLHPRGAISRNFTIPGSFARRGSFRSMPFDCFSLC